MVGSSNKLVPVSRPFFSYSPISPGQRRASENWSPKASAGPVPVVSWDLTNQYEMSSETEYTMESIKYKSVW